MMVARLTGDQNDPNIEPITMTATSEIITLTLTITVITMSP